MDMKTEFLEEINKIKNELLKKAALKMVEDAPTYFWTVAASSTGKYHPQISLGEGGLVRHSLMTCAIAKDLLTAEIFIPESDDNKDLVIITSLFHDIIKRGNGGDPNFTVHEHPLLSAEFVRNHLVEVGVSKEIIDVISDAIEHHMGKWVTGRNSTVVLTPPQNDFEKLIHTADYMASRKYIKGLEHWQMTL